jgi:anti-sigma28 factor (negative regulator of flagellin synthesis)
MIRWTTVIGGLDPARAKVFETAAYHCVVRTDSTWYRWIIVEHGSWASWDTFGPFPITDFPHPLTVIPNNNQSPHHKKRETTRTGRTMTSESTPLTDITSKYLTKENAAVAGTFAKEKFEEIRKQVNDGDYSIRLFALLGGILLIVLSATEFLGKVLTLHVFSALIEVYTFLLGVVVLILEGKGQIPFFPAHLADKIQNYAMILRYVWGRGGLYFVAGTLQLSQLGLFDLIAGAFMTCVGVVYIVVGTKAHNKMKELKNLAISDATLKTRFQQADSNNSGKLDVVSFKNLILSLGMGLNRREVETAFIILDKDGDGLVGYDEFENWWKASDEPGMFQLV